MFLYTICELEAQLYYMIYFDIFNLLFGVSVYDNGTKKNGKILILRYSRQKSLGKTFFRGFGKVKYFGKKIFFWLEIVIYSYCKNL
ncbi:hypothetical protein BLM37_02520 [Candidatus Gracilibacteria bacterium GN02-873]|nr:hypothetical protein BLM37_02520 [Candidatus Gracilibacteria bacterium GN02-873]